MKKKIIWLVLLVFLILLVGGIILSLFKDSPKNGTLIVNGVKITDKNVIIYSDHDAQLPMTEVLKCLGMNVNWIDQNTAEITNEDKKYILNLSEVSLIENGTNNDFLLTPPGGERYYKVLERELLLDNNTLFCAFSLMKIKTHIKIERKGQMVYIFVLDETIPKKCS